jgi:hypothetical protein
LKTVGAQEKPLAPLEVLWPIPSLGHIKYKVIVFLLPLYFFWLGQDGNATRKKNDVNFVLPKRKLRLRESKVSKYGV